MLKELTERVIYDKIMDYNARSQIDKLVNSMVYLFLVQVFPAHQWLAPSAINIFIFIVVGLNTLGFMISASSFPSIAK